jgi:hypothetical protein
LMTFMFGLFEETEQVLNLLQLPEM